MATRLRERLLTMLLTMALLVGGGMALAAVGSVTEADPAEPTCSAAPSEVPVPTDSTTTDEGDGSTTDEGDGSTTDEGDGSTTDEGDGSTTDDENCDEATDDTSSGEDTTDDSAGDTQDTTPPTDVTDPIREAECNDAAGVDPTVEPAVDVTTPTTGLDHAIEQVLANCLKNPGAPGLPNALTHLVANAERKAAHDAAKAAGEHGKSGEHGPDAVHGKSGEHGNPHD